MKVKIYFILIVLATFCFGCKQGQKKQEVKKIETKHFFYFGTNKYQQEKLFPTPEIFHVLNNDTVVITNDSIFVYLPKNLFIDTEGKIVEKYNLYFTMVLKKEDMLLSNLQTISGNTFLESSGMFNISAFDEYGNPLNISNGKSIGIELGMTMPDDKMMLYYGGDQKGMVNWVNPVESEKYLVNIPLPKDNWVLNGYLERYFDTTGKTQQIQNSYIATREFIKTRLPRSGSDTGLFFKIYMENRDKDLYVADSLCMVAEKAERYQWVDGFKSGVYNYDKNSKSGYVDTTEYYLHYLEKLTKPKIINTYGVDLDKPNARELLKGKGLTEKQIDEAFILHNRRKRVVQSMDSEKKYTSYFEINKLGWYNFDKELGFDNTQYVYLRTNVTGSQPAYTNLYYVLDNYNSLIAGYNISDNSYCIAQKDDYKFKLPLNEPFTVVAISYTENGILLATEKFKVKENNEINLDMKPITQDSLKVYLDRIM